MGLAMDVKEMSEPPTRFCSVERLFDACVVLVVHLDRRLIAIAACALRAIHIQLFPAQLPL